MIFLLWVFIEINWMHTKPWDLTDAPMSLEEVTDVIVSEATLNFLWKVMAVVEGSWGLEENKCYLCFYEMQEGLGKLQDKKPSLDPWEDDGANPPGNHFQAEWGQSDWGEVSMDLWMGNLAWSIWLVFCDKMTGSVEWGENSGCFLPWFYQGLWHCLP